MSIPALHSVLLIEDSDDDADLTTRRLGSGFAVTRADTAATVEAALVAGGWDLVLSDWNVPGVDTTSVLRAVADRLPGTPCILLTGFLPIAQLVAAMQMGARDCFEKGELSGLRAAVLREIASATATAEALRRERALVESNALLLAETTEQRKLFEALHQVALAASGELDVQRLVELIIASGSGLLGDVDGGLTLWDDAAECLRIFGGPPGGDADSTALLPASQGAHNLAFTGLQPVIVNNFGSRPPRLDSMVSVGFQSILAVPLVVNGKPIGALAFVTLRPHEFTDHDADVAIMLAAQLAPAIVAARSHADMARRGAEQALVAEIGRAAASRAGEAQLAEMALGGLTSLLDAEAAGVLQASGDGMSVREASGWLKDMDRPVGSRGDLGPAGTVEGEARLQRTLNLPMLTSCSGLNIEHLGEPAMLVVCRSSGLAFAESDLNFLASIGSMLTESSRTAAAERALRESDERYGMLFDSSLEGVWYGTLEGRTLYANGRMAEILHTDVATLEQRSMWDFYEPAAGQEMRERFTAQPEGFSGRYERTLTAVDGAQVLTSIGASSTRDADGIITGMVALVTDLSDRVVAEQAVAESEAKSGFLAGMSHELRTPLNSILGFTQLLEDSSFGALNERQLRYLGHVRSQGQHLLELINDVLDLSKVAAGRLEFAQEDVNLAIVAADVAARLGPLAAAKSQELRVEVVEGAIATGDRLRVTQALMNLLSNAMKFTPDGGHIGIAVIRRGAHYMMSVTDDGPGIAIEDQALAFDEFSKLSAGRRGEGTGLGLSLTRRLTEAMGGHVSLWSELGKGSIFTIELASA